MLDDDRLLTLDECARLIGLKRTACYKVRLLGDFPRPVRVTATRERYWRSEVIAWLDGRRVG
jgi:predicted DNA-binding transcriptional regulator AlpA